MQDSTEDGGVPSLASGTEDGGDQPDVGVILGRGDRRDGAADAEVNADEPFPEGQRLSRQAYLNGSTSAVVSAPHTAASAMLP
ncbi:hypothetical protein [Nocardia sp. NPDC005998]|uniref:hypothetical protein n=1 Tax=Nocardia sp. NPDC005998 TaxID=3156894 RepID=UPI0033BCCCF7